MDYLKVIALGATNCSVVKCTGIGKGIETAVHCSQAGKDYFLKELVVT